MKKLGLSFIILLHLCVSCDETESLERVLRLSEENRPELERVLNHYSSNSSDRLKQEAAKFLIRNMPGHGFFADSVTTGYYKTIDSLYSRLPSYVKQSLLCLPKYYNPHDLNIEEDVHHITARFLIDHIDRSFELWQGTSWGKTISFDLFCEYILPYRAGHEPLYNLTAGGFPKQQLDSLLTPWRDYTIDMFAFQTYAMTRIFPVLSLQYNLPAPISDPTYHFDCIPDAFQYMLTNKFIGIPAAVDFSPHWPDRNGRHYWANIITPSLKKVTHFENINPRYAKVYRKTYSHNPTPCGNGRDFIPPLFREPFNKDVTELYSHTADIIIEINKKPFKPDHAYLCVFNECSWEPISWCEVRKKIATFEKTGVGNVYLPIFFHHEMAVSGGGYPFILQHDGTIKNLIPNKTNTSTLHIKRKYLINARQLLWDSSLEGLMVKGSHAETFTEEELLHTVVLDDSAPYFAVQFTPPKKIRFWKFEVPANSRPPEIAEIRFYDTVGNNIEINSLVVQCNQDNGRRFPDSLFDGDNLTFTHVRKHLVIDFKREVAVSKIEFTARNDDNYIMAGDTYELLYRDIDRWVSVETKKAENRFVEFRNVPGGALYWLRDLTRGREERIFTIEGEKSVFW